MSEQNINQTYNSFEDEESDIDWQLYLTRAWQGRKTILITTIIATVIGLVAAFSVTKRYTVEVTLAPELGGSKGGGGLSSIASMLGVGGMQMGSSADAYSVTMYPKVISSTPFIIGLLDTPVKDAKNDIDTTFYGYLNREPKFSIFALPGMAISGLMSLISSGEKEDTNQNQTEIDVFRLTKKQARIVSAVSKAVVANVDNKSGETTISVTLDNPVIAATIADSVCAHLRDYIVNYRTSKAREDLDYYQKLADESRITYEEASAAYAYYQDHNRGLILNSVISEGTRLQNELNIAAQVYTQMKQQAEMARAKVQEEKPVFAVIQPASVPLRSVNSRKNVLLIFLFLGFAGSLAWVVLGKEYFDKTKEMYANIKKG